MIFTTPSHERKRLEVLVAQSMKRLEHFRRDGRELQAALEEADMNRLLEEMAEKGRVVDD